MRFWNKYTLIGTILIIIGMPLSLVWVGIPLMMIGFFVAGFGIIHYIIKRFPGLDKKIRDLVNMIKKSYEPYFRKDEDLERSRKKVNQK